MSQTARAHVKAAPVPKHALTSARGALLQRKCACGGSAESKCEKCSEEGQTLQRHGTGSAPASIPPVVHDVLGSPGRPLDAHTRSFMESRFGHDFGSVRVHDDTYAIDSARAVNAAAYTVGNHIAFDRGQYRPETHVGRQLLAHELAHTVQQSGLRCAGRDVKLGGATESHLEMEAAAAAVGAGSEAHAPSLLSRAHAPLLSRQPADPPAPEATGIPTASLQSAEDPEKRVWEKVPASDPVAKLGVTHWSKLPAGDIKPRVRAFRLKSFPLSPKKGPVLKIWQAHAKEGALESTIDTSGTVVRAGQKQGWPSTDVLRDYWLQKVRWDATSAPKNWEAAGGDPSKTFNPKVKGQTCHIDHIVELQIGGTNIKENMQVLDGPENMESGRETFSVLKTKAIEIRAEQPGLENVVLHYDKVEQAGVECGSPSCCSVEQKSIEMKGPGGGGGDDVVPYTIQAGGTRTQIYVPKKGPKDKKAGQDVLIYESDIPENVSALRAFVDVSIDLEAAAGPGQILDGRIEGTIKDLLGDSRSLSLDLSGKLHFPAYFKAAGTISGGLTVNVLVGDVSGSIGVTVETLLDGKGETPFKAHFGDGKLVAEADFEVYIGLLLTLSLIAAVEIEYILPFPPYKKREGKVWDIAKWKYRPGFGVRLKPAEPLRSSSDKDFTPPNMLVDIPEFDIKKLLIELFKMDEGIEYEIYEIESADDCDPVKTAQGDTGNKGSSCA